MHTQSIRLNLERYITMNRFRYISLLVLILLCADVHGQYFKKLTMKDGLSNPSVLAIYQDTLGRMWFGTNEGVNVYDGNQISRYKSYNVVRNGKQERELLNGTVNGIVGDSQGNVLLLNKGALIKYDIRKEAFHKIVPRDIGALAVLGEEVWCSVRDSLFRYDLEGDSLRFDRKLGTTTVTCLAKMDEKIWIGTSNGLYVLAGDELSCVLPDVEIFKLFVSSRKELWIASRMQGLYKVGRDGKLVQEEHSPTRVVSQQIRGFLEDEWQNIWFGTFEGLQVYNPYQDTYRVYRPDYHPGALEHQSVFSLYRDRQGTIWVGTYYGGVNYFNQSKDVFFYYPHDIRNNHCLNFPIAGQMVEDKDHNLWIGTDGGGVNLLNKATGTFTYYTSSGKNSILHNNVKTLSYDKRNDRIYIGTYTGGISCYDRKSARFSHYLDHYRQTGEGPNHIIYHSMFKDGWLYVTARNGFWRIQPEKNEFQLLNEKYFFLTFEIDSRGYIWLADNFKLYRMKAGEWNQLENVGLEESADGARITRIMEAADGTVYVATLGDGVYAYSHETGKWKHYTKENSHLLSDFCYNLAETHMNNILITCGEGFSIYSPFNNSISSIELGLKGGISAVTEACGILVADDDLIYMGGVDGMIAFREKDLLQENEEDASDFYFSNLYINNVKIAPDDGSGVLSQSLPFTKHLSLSAGQNNIMLDFSSSDYVELEGKDEYLYKLEGFDKEWILTDQLRVNYTNLAPGRYVLKVRESGTKVSDGARQEITLAITIHRPWFATFWAYLFYFLVIAVIVYSFWRVRMARRALALSLAAEKNEKERIEEVNKMKLRFFTNISHEFRTPLTLIIGQVEMLLQMEKLAPAVNKRLHGIYRNAINLRLLITELLDFRKQEQGFMKLRVERVETVAFVKDIYRLFADFARKKNIEYVFEDTGEAIDLWFDPVQMQKVVFNLLSNAFKYTPEGKSIKVSVRRQQRMVEIAVADTGCGISPENKQKIFERFYQVGEYSRKGIVGSGIGLALLKGIVDAHKGEIKVDSVTGEGSTFRICLPVGNGHFTREELEYEKTVKAFSNREDMFKDEIALLNDRMEKSEAEPDGVEDKNEGMPRVLLVEDDEEVLEMLVSIFSPTYTVYKATDGKTGFEMAQQWHPDIVVSDVMMPVMSGKEMCYKIKNCLELAYMPVVLLTAQTSEDCTIEGYMFGADDYITKPFNVKLLLTRCGNLLRNRKKLLGRVAQAEVKEMPGTGSLNVAEQELLDKATEIIKRNFSNPEFDMNMLASELGMGRSKMFVRLKEVVGLTPNEFTLKLKLEEALRLLQEAPQYNISEISYQLGFASPRYFSRCFKDFYGVSPQTYRKEPSEGKKAGE